jgi:DNA-binding winged helix-turn-helix (wHTH) protein/TolB-like protein/Tfp pilus assembly protein PilF
MADIFRFGSFVLDRGAYRLLNGTTPVDLSPKAIDLLHLFVTRPGSLVTKDDMLAALWPGIAVTDNALTQVVSELRQALNDQPQSPTFVQTVPRRGYRFIAEVIEGVRPGADRVQTGVRRGADDGQTGVGQASDEGQTRVRPDADTGRPRAVFVADFANVTGDADVAWLASGIAETLANDLRAVADLAILDRSLIPAAARSAEGAASPDVWRAAGVQLLVTGSFQRAGDALRITARVVDVATREVVADAKADGALAGVFAVQDAMVRELTAALPLTLTPAAARRLAARETSSLEAYRAVTEGRLKLESLDMDAISAASEDFARALALDPGYALAHVGLAHAEFWRFQATRARTQPDRDAAARAIAHARRAVEIDPELAEAHGALALFLAAGDRPREAKAAGRIAVALEPANWRHQFRLGMAEWGRARLICLERVAELFPSFGYTYFGIAMVHVAGSALGQAAATLARGIAAQDQAPAAARFPARGLNWLLGLTHLASGRLDDAAHAFDRELTAPKAGMFAAEYDADAHHAVGQLALLRSDASGAAAAFERALELYPDQARSLIGLAQAIAAKGHRDRAASLLARADVSIDAMTGAGRRQEAALARACWHLASNRPDGAASVLMDLLEAAPPGPTGWTIPVEPALAPLRARPAFGSVLARLSRGSGLYS